MIDTLAYAKELEAAGLERRQAEAHARALNEAIAHEVVSQQHFDQELQMMRAHFDQELALVRANMRHMRWMIGINTALILVTLAAVLAT